MSVKYNVSFSGSVSEVHADTPLEAARMGVRDILGEEVTKALNGKEMKVTELTQPVTKPAANCYVNRIEYNEYNNTTTIKTYNFHIDDKQFNLEDKYLNKLSHGIINNLDKTLATTEKMLQTATRQYVNRNRER